MSKKQNMARALQIKQESNDHAYFQSRQPKVVQLHPVVKSNRRTAVSSVVTLLVLAIWIGTSLLSDSLFLKEALVSSFIIVCLLFFKRAGQKP